MTASEFFYWAADNVALWAPLAVAWLGVFILACIYWWSLSWEEDR